MATPRDDETNRKKRTEKASRIGDVVAKHRAALNAEIKAIDPHLVVELAVGPALDKPIKADEFWSDWPDTWNDGGRWVKTWGKGGGDELMPLEELRERMLLARTRQELER